MVASVEKQSRVGAEEGGVLLRKTIGNSYLISAVVGVGIWALLAGRIVPFLPTPLAVAQAFVEALTSAEFYRDMAVTFRRVTVAAAGAWLIAVPLGILMARYWQIDTVANPAVFIGLALPAPLSIFISILIFGLGETTTLIALWAVVTPYVVTIIYAGSMARDKKLQEVATVYRFSWAQELRHITLPELGPSLMSGARFGFAMGWKIVVLVEALSSNVGIGERLNFFFVFNQPHRVLAWTLTFTVVMVIVEILVFRSIERRVFDWRISRGLPGEAIQRA